MKPSDAVAVAELAFKSMNPVITSAFKDKKEEGIKLLAQHYRKNPENIFVLTEGLDIIGAIKIVLQNNKDSISIGFRELIKHLGLLKGIRAGLLLAPWDEYAPKTHEAFVEFLNVDPEWLNSGAVDLLLDKCKAIAQEHSKKFLSIFTESQDFRTLGRFEKWGFSDYKKSTSFLAKLLGGPYKWRKLVAPVSNDPITIKEMVLQKVQIVKQLWVDRKEEFIFATKLATGLTAVPIIAGSFAYYRGYYLAAYGWVLVVLAHLIGVAMVYKEIEFGRIALSTAVVLESGNMVLRALATLSWTDRTWLLILASINLYIAYVMLFSQTYQNDMRETAPLEKPKPIENFWK